MILPQVHLRKPCYDFYFHQRQRFHPSASIRPRHFVYTCACIEKCSETLPYVASVKSYAGGMGFGSGQASNSHRVDVPTSPMAALWPTSSKKKFEKLSPPIERCG